MNKKKILFINTRQAQCSIYQTGKTIYETLVCDEYILHYTEIPHLSREDFFQGRIGNENLFQYYDVYLFNCHPLTFCRVENISTDVIGKFDGLKINITFEVDPNDPYPKSIYDNFNINVFDRHMVLDPTFNVESDKFYAFHRPLDGYRKRQFYKDVPKIPIIGTHGLPNNNKFFIEIMKQASFEFENSIIRINVPNATYMGSQITNDIINECLINKPENVQLVVSNIYFEDRNCLIDWCSQNDLNVFFYNRSEPGLAAASDEAILSGSPICITENKHFRHLHKFITSFPTHNFSDCILHSQKEIQNMSKVYNKENFILKFKEIIRD